MNDALGKQLTRKEVFCLFVCTYDFCSAAIYSCLLVSESEDAPNNTCHKQQNEQTAGIPENKVPRLLFKDRLTGQ